MKRIILLALAAVLGASCSNGPGASSIELSLEEFSITPSAGVYRPGPVELVASNDGEFGHTIVVTTESGAVVAASELIPPGESVTLTVDLDRGAYVISCRIVTASGDGSLFDHYERGMVTEVTEGA